MNKASGSDGIPAEIFQILKDGAVKVIHSICQQIWKTQQWPQDWKTSVFISISKKGNAKECSNYRTIEIKIPLTGYFCYSILIDGQAGVSFIRALNPFKLTPDLITFQRPQLLINSLWESGYQPMNVCVAGGWGHRYSICSSSLGSSKCKWNSESSTVLQGGWTVGRGAAVGQGWEDDPATGWTAWPRAGRNEAETLTGLQYLCETNWSLEHEPGKTAAFHSKCQPEVQRWIFHNSVF